MGNRQEINTQKSRVHNAKETNIRVHHIKIHTEVVEGKYM